MKKPIKSDSNYGPYLKVTATGEVGEFAGYEPAIQIFDIEFSDGKLKRLHHRQVEPIPPHEARTHLIRARSKPRSC